jgi:hypothetical protein
VVKELTVHGVPRLGVFVGSAARGTALTRILSMKGAPGWRVGSGAVSRWELEGVTESEGAAWLYGPHAAGVPLEEALALPLGDALPLLSRLVAALNALVRDGIPLFPLQADAVIFCDNGDVLFLPPAVMREIRDMTTFALTRDTYETLNHPDLDGQPRASFSIAVMLYRLITGRYPFTGESPEEIHERARKLAVVPPDGFAPALAPEISAAVMEGLGRQGSESVTLEEWSRHLAAWQAMELFRTVSSAQEEKALLAAGSRRAGSERVYRRRVFWEKHWKTAAIAAAAAAILAALLGSILGNVLKPRLTRGYSPLKVVETFYDSMNSLDHEAIQACVIGTAGQEELSQVTTLYVTSRVTQGYEGKSSVLSAAEWNRHGRLKLAGSQSLFGVTGLAVTQEEGEPMPVFQAAYDKWTPAPTPSKASALSAGPSLFEGHRKVDRLWLKRDRGDWMIYRIEHIRDDLLPTPG